jgi:hypothetical protein
MKRRVLLGLAGIMAGVLSFWIALSIFDRGFYAVLKTFFP